MTFDFDKVRKRLVNSRTIHNVDGIHQVSLILKCLKISPFIEVVSDFLDISRANIYVKLKYYLTEDEFQSLLKALKVERRIKINALKRHELHRLESNIKK